MDRRRAPTAAGLVLAALASAVAAWTPSAHAAGGVTLTIEAVSFRGTKGQAIVAVFDAAESWPKLEKARRLVKVKPIAGGKIKVDLRDLPPGVYAASVIHDENENGKLDMRWLPLPKPIEGAGASNDAKATVGPPSWADARFRLGERGGVMKIRMRYW